jgi:MYXO-CTERM domain-containing protein
VLGRLLILGLGGCLLGLPARAASHPAGVPYPLRPATLQPAGLAQPLPSTRRYVLVWKDQLIPDPYTEAQKDWVVTHYVGTQKLFQRQIDAYRTKNPNFLLLVYHLAFGLNGADQANPVGNITGPNQYGQEDTDTFTPWVAANNVTRENAYQHSTTPAGPATRVSYPDPYWLMDIASPEWRVYVGQTLLAWAAFPSSKATGFFLDVAFPPWYNYSPASWWTEPAGGSSRQALLAWWSPRAQAYFDALRTDFQPGASHPRYLVVPNPDALVDSTDEPTFLEGTDGVFTENWQAILANPGDWNLSVRRICQYATGRGKVWMADVTEPGTNVSLADRALLIGTYLLIRNGTSYPMFGNSDLTWYPEYEIDLGGYVDEPPTDLESLRVAGTGGASGGLYARPYVAGMVLVNSSASALGYSLPTAMHQAQWSGGGAIASDATQAPQSLTYVQTVGPGSVSVPARSVLVLQSVSGPPPPGVEPGDATDGGVDGGAGGPDGGSNADGGSGGPDGGPGNGGVSEVTSSCGCSSTGAGAWPAALVVALGLVGRKRRSWRG